LLRAGIGLEVSDKMTPVDREEWVNDVNKVIDDMNVNKTDRWRF